MFRRNLARRGLGRRPIVCYDDASGATAARLWWMLDAIGHPVSVLDGGLAAWTGWLEHGDIEHGASEFDTSDPAGIGDPLIRDWPPERVIDAEGVLDSMDGGATLLDARGAERFRGEPNPVDPVPGHIPGARSRPWTENVGPDGLFRPVEELRREFAELGASGGVEWLASCGSGVTACHNLLAVRFAGVADGRLYPGSWSEWIKDSSRPVATGATSSITPPDGDGAG